MMEFFLQHIPTWNEIIHLAPSSIIVILFAGWFSGVLKRRYQLKTNYTRKIFHFFIFSFAGFLHWRYGLTAVFILGGAMGGYLAAILFLADGNLFYEALAREQDAPHRSFYIIISFLATAVGGIVSNILFFHFAIVGYLVAGWGDAVGEPVGVRFGRRPYRVPSFGNIICHRTIEGSCAVAIVSFIAAFIGLNLLLHLPVAFSLVLGFVTAIIVTFVEAFSTHGIDNLTIQLVASGVPFLLVKIFLS